MEPASPKLVVLKPFRLKPDAHLFLSPWLKPGAIQEPRNPFNINRINTVL